MLDDKQKSNMAESAEKAEKLLKLLANKYRLQILCSLASGEKNAGELEEESDLSQSAISQHLAKLRESDVVIAQKRGQMVYYKLASIEVNAILSTLYLIYCNK
ncbi:ArsR/SmtB family transcription factor [Pseudocolwellia agarivorans]|uniref:ArsR/SmtB family transcription factor n=1 Tax=Pseudocolwellia agarivorans TaxID=1911682 RepID=UPI003F8858F6